VSAKILLVYDPGKISYEYSSFEIVALLISLPIEIYTDVLVSNYYLV
jgi:hypothetical protein